MSEKKNRNTDKYDDAVNRARGVEDDETGDDAFSSQLVEDGGREALARLYASGNLEMGERFVSLKPGQMISGVLLGQGETEIMDRRTGELRLLKTWHFRHKTGMPYSICGSAVLDTRLPSFLGRSGIVHISRGQKIQLDNGNMMSDYAILGPKEDAPPARYFTFKLGGSRVYTTPQLSLPSVNDAKVLPSVAVNALDVKTGNAQG